MRVGKVFAEIRFVIVLNVCHPMITPSTFDVLDLSTLQELHAVLEDALLEIVQAFLEGLDTETAAIMQACEQDANSLRRSAHSLKGSSANMGAKALSDICGQIERQAYQGNIDACCQLFPALQQLKEQTKLALHAYVQQ
jgi:HPt (histidine-containing phosphotransfer) domain-containing protein